MILNTKWVEYMSTMIELRIQELKTEFALDPSTDLPIDTANWDSMISDSKLYQLSDNQIHILGQINGLNWIADILQTKLHNELNPSLLVSLGLSPEDEGH